MILNYIILLIDLIYRLDLFSQTLIVMSGSLHLHLEKGTDLLCPNYFVFIVSCFYLYAEIVS